MKIRGSLPWGTEKFTAREKDCVMVKSMALPSESSGFESLLFALSLIFFICIKGKIVTPTP